MKRVMMMVPVCLALSATAALAVDQAVKDACREDYHTFCDKLEVGSEELRACMRKSATNLSKPCLKALVEYKEVTPEDIERYLKEMEQKAEAQN